VHSLAAAAMAQRDVGSLIGLFFAWLARPVERAATGEFFSHNFIGAL